MAFIQRSLLMRIYRLVIRLSYYSINARGSNYYLWAGIVSLACLYNILIIPMGFFNEFYFKFYKIQVILNSVSNLIYIIDFILQLFKGFFVN